MSDFNFKRLEDDTIDINTELDVGTLINSIYVGPQGEILSLLENFNEDYNCDLGITKQFTLKPGGYDKLKKAYANHVLRWDMKPRGIESIFKRINEYGWRANSFKTDAQVLENKIQDLRVTGIRWQDNTDDFVNEFSKVKSIINSGLNNIKAIYPQHDIEIKLMPVAKKSRNMRSHYGTRNVFPFSFTGNNTEEYLLIVYIKLNKPIMTVHILNADNETVKHEIPMNDILCCSGMYLLPAISRIWGKEELDSRVQGDYNREPFFLEAAYLSLYDFHPYIQISSDLHAYKLDGEALVGNICTGTMGNEIKSTLHNLQIEAHIMQLINWLTHYYIPQTNPLNRIGMIKHLGQPKAFADIDNTVFAERDHLPIECNLPQVIKNNITNYGRKRHRVTHFGSASYNYDYGSIEYMVRIGAYINSLKIKDLPCSECTLFDECDIKDNIYLFLKEDNYTPMEEGYIGMFWEIKELLNSRHNIDALYIEELVQFSWRFAIEEEYEAFLQAHAIAEYATDVGSSNRYKQILRIVFSKSKNVRLKLLTFENKLKDWHVDEISDFNESLKERYTKKQKEIAQNESFEDATNALEEELALEELSPEEQVLRWASLNGGTINL